MTEQGSPAVTVVGSVHMDLIASAPRLPYRGETLPGLDFATHPGGKGGNQATQVALMGVRSHFIGRVGKDSFGDQLRDALAAKGVDVAHLSVDDVVQTGVSTVLAEERGDYASIIVPAAGLRLTPDLVRAARSVFVHSTVLLTQLELAPETVAAAVALARSLGKTVVLNAAPAPSGGDRFPPDFWRAVDLLIVNAGEARMLASEPASDDAGDPASASLTALLLRDRLGIDVVVVTIGGAGSIVADATGTRQVAGHRTTVVDTIGAGDAFSGALAAELARRSSLGDALAIATAAGTLAVTKAGAHDALPTAAEVRRFLEARSEESLT